MFLRCSHKNRQEKENGIFFFCARRLINTVADWLVASIQLKTFKKKKKNDVAVCVCV